MGLIADDAAAAAAPAAATTTKNKKRAKGGGGGGGREDPKSWTAFLKEKTLSLVAGRPNVATSGKFLVKYARTIAK